MIQIGLIVHRRCLQAAQDTTRLTNWLRCGHTAELCEDPIDDNTAGRLVVRG
jgi:hypothetical protein